MTTLSNKIKKFKQIISGSQNIVFFGGAGVSTESGIPDFRSAQGIFTPTGQNIRPETVVSHSFFMHQPDQFYKFYREKLIYPEAKPNAAHLALARLESTGKLKSVITQNIDGLHQMAGSINVAELHGSVHRNYCSKCNKFFSLEYILASSTVTPYCDSCGAIVKPDVVLYEEALNDQVMTQAVNALSNADVLIVAGTSLVVYPAAGLINHFTGQEIVLINLSSTELDSNATLIIKDYVGRVLDFI